MSDLSDIDVLGVEAWFWDFVDVRGPDDCWPWIGPAGSAGRYGHTRIWVGRRKEYVHRLAHVLSGGVIPPGTVVQHLCDFPLCCAPHHLRSGTIAENNEQRDS